MKNDKHIPCLDGLRAISILLVMIFHSLSHGNQGFPRFWFPFGGAAGVSLFFVISGYLITTLLLAEQERYQKISLKNFYLRRSLRIFPPFYLFLLAVVSLSHIGFTSAPPQAVFASGAYWMNFYSGNAGSLGHTWSLSIEEQFYLVWPFVVARCSRRLAIGFAVLVAAGWPLLRLLRHGYLFSPIPEEALRSSGLDTILWGSVLALLVFKEVPGWLSRPLKSIWPLIASLSCLLFIYSVKEQWPLSVVFLLPLLRNVSLTVLLWWSINNPQSLWGRCLELPPVAFIGRLSYSLYLWHGMFIVHADRWLCTFPMSWVASFVAAYASYRLVELPFNKLRRNFRPAT